MDSLHERLAEQHPSYADWHKLAGVSLLHFAVLLTVVTSAVLILDDSFQATNSQLASVATALQAPSARFAPGRLLVQFKPGVSDADAKGILAGQSANISSTISQIRTHIVKVPVGAEERVRLALSHNPKVSVAELDYVAETHLVPNDPSYTSEWFSKVIGEPAGWDISVGSPTVVVAVLDSGIGPTPDTQNNLVPGYDLLTNSPNVVTDSCMHGPAVAGVIANEGNNGQAIASIGWHVKVMPITIANASLSCNTYYSTIAQGITYAVDHGAKVVTVSYGGASANTTVDNAASYAWSKNVPVFASAGNANGPVDYPAAAPDVVAVGATAAAATASGDTRASYSNYGTALDISAPGSNILTNYGTGYAGWTGTSFSSPMAAGLAALIFSVNPSLTASQVVDLMEKNADDLGTAGWDQYYGWGRINVARTLAAAKTATTFVDTLAPTVSITAPAGGSSVQGGVSVAVSAQDNIAVAKVELYIDGTLSGTTSVSPYSFYWDTSTIPAGAHTLTAKAYDTSNNVTTSAPVSVTVSAPPADTTPPTVTITAPANGSTIHGKGSVSVSASASDNKAVTLITIAVDGKSLASCTNATTCSGSLSSKTLTSGTHTVTASAKDAAGNAATATSTFIK